MSVIDSEIKRTARELWPSARRLEAAAGGLFNRVVRVHTPTGITFLKRFTDAASSADFPPLPTSAAQRCLIASTWHQLAMQASLREPGVRVPSLLAVQTAFDLVAMEGLAGEPLYDALRSGAAMDETLHQALAWLAGLHELPLAPRDLLSGASRPFKDFKVDLQYTRVLPEVPGSLHASARAFIEGYLRTEAQAVHGDLNSRNVLVSSGSVAVIDFEQGHFGEGIYDVAYLLSEYVIRDLRLARDPERTICRAWDVYCQACTTSPDPAARVRLRVHLAFQTLYRLVGPSRRIWTGHLQEQDVSAVRRWSEAQLTEWLQ